MGISWGPMQDEFSSSDDDTDPVHTELKARNEKTFERKALEWILLGNARTDPTIDNIVFHSSASELLIIFVDAALLAVRLLVYSFVGVSSVFIFWFPAMQDSYLDFFNVNTTAKERVFIADSREGPVFGPIRPHWDIIWTLYFPVSSLVFLRLSKKEAAALLSLAVASTLVGHALNRIYVLGTVSRMLPVLVWPLITLAVAGRRVLQFKLLGEQIGAFLLGILTSVCQPWINDLIQDKHVARIVQLVVIFPVLREAGYALVKSSARWLALSPLTTGVDRRVTWLFVLWFQYASALYVRTMLFRFQTDSTLAGLLIFQSLLEIVLRLTAPYRGIWLARIKHSLCARCPSCASRLLESGVPLAPSRSLSSVNPLSSRGRQNSVELLVGPRINKRATTTVSLHTSQRWFAIPLVGEMLTEYAAIITASIITVMCHQDLIRFPIDYFAGLENPFEVSHAIIMSDAIANAIWQIAAELLVDSICVSIEKQRGFDLAWVFNRRHRFFAVIFFAATWFGNTAMGFIISHSGDSFANCLGKDMCECAAGAAGGLSSSGLRQLYCEYIDA